MSDVQIFFFTGKESAKGPYPVHRGLARADELFPVPPAKLAMDYLTDTILSSTH
jgi:hypothetical protein